MAAPPSLGTLRTADVARVLGVSEARVRALVRAGWCAPERRGRALAFRFQDLVVLRAAESLRDAHVPAARMRRALRALARELGGPRELAGVRILADGTRVVVHAGGARFEPESGQLLLDFSVDALARAAAQVTRANLAVPRAPREDPRAPLPAGGQRPARDAAPRGLAPGHTGAPAAAAGDEGEARSAARALAERAFAEALACEDDDPAAAMRAYRRALARDPSFSDAAMNLARLVHRSGRAREAVALYRAALPHAPGDAELHYNLALALEDAKGAAAAIHHYEHALALDPDFADAHWNLAGLLDAAGRKQDALRHYRAYERLTR
jgi:tetratricopeptide (TPR) repeat protein